MGLLLMSSKSLTGPVASRAAHYGVQARSIHVAGALGPLLSLHAQRNLGCTHSHQASTAALPSPHHDSAFLTLYLVACGAPSPEVLINLGLGCSSELWC